MDDTPQAQCPCCSPTHVSSLKDSALMFRPSAGREGDPPEAINIAAIAKG